MKLELRGVFGNGELATVPLIALDPENFSGDEISLEIPDSLLELEENIMNVEYESIYAQADYEFSSTQEIVESLEEHQRLPWEEEGKKSIFARVGSLLESVENLFTKDRELEEQNKELEERIRELEEKIQGPEEEEEIVEEEIVEEEIVGGETEEI